MAFAYPSNPLTLMQLSQREWSWMSLAGQFSAPEHVISITQLREFPRVLVAQPFLAVHTGKFQKTASPS